MRRTRSLAWGNLGRAFRLAAKFAPPVIVTTMWCRSYFADDRYAWRVVSGNHAETSLTVRGVSSAAGAVQFRLMEFSQPIPLTRFRGPRPANSESLWKESLASVSRSHIGGIPRGYSGLGFVWWSPGTSRTSYTHWSRRLLIVIPYWFLTAVATTPLIVSLIIRAARSRRSRCGKCIHCGYDLRASPGRGPECGGAGAGAGGVPGVDGEGIMDERGPRSTSAEQPSTTPTVTTAPAGSS